MNIIDNIYLKNTKNGYHILYTDINSQLCFTCNVPFGIEQFYNHKIINIEFDKSCNAEFNDVQLIKCIEDEFMTLNDGKKNHKVSIDSIMASNLYNKKFITSLKDRNNKKCHLRCYVKPGLDILDPDDKHVMPGMIINKKCEFKINISKLWTHKDTFGLNWIITQIKIL